MARNILFNEFARRVLSEEVEISKRVRESVNEFAENYKQVEELKEKVDELENNNKQLASVFYPVAEELENRMIETQRAVVKIKRATHTRVVPKYKAVYEGLIPALRELDKINGEVLDIILETMAKLKKANSSITSVSPTFSVNLDEGVMDTLKDVFLWLKRQMILVWQKAKGLKRNTNRLNQLVDDALENFEAEEFA